MQNLEDLESRLQERLDYLGEGCYARVFEHPANPNLVVKMQRPNPSGLIEEDTWPVFVEFCRHNPSKFAPKVHHLKWLTDKCGRRVYIAVMERLTTTISALEYDHIARAYHNVATAVFEGFPNSVSERDKATIGADYEPLVAWMSLMHTTLIPVCCVDLHTRNAMLRANGDYVVTDPVFLCKAHSRDQAINHVRRSSTTAIAA